MLNWLDWGTCGDDKDQKFSIDEVFAFKIKDSKYDVIDPEKIAKLCTHLDEE